MIGLRPPALIPSCAHERTTSDSTSRIKSQEGRAQSPAGSNRALPGRIRYSRSCRGYTGHAEHVVPNPPSMLEPTTSQVLYSSALSAAATLLPAKREASVERYARGDPNEPAPMTKAPVRPLYDHVKMARRQTASGGAKAMPTGGNSWVFCFARTTRCVVIATLSPCGRRLRP